MAAGGGALALGAENALGFGVGGMGVTVGAGSGLLSMLVVVVAAECSGGSPLVATGVASSLPLSSMG